MHDDDADADDDADDLAMTIARLFFFENRRANKNDNKWFHTELFLSFHIQTYSSPINNIFFIHKRYLICKHAYDNDNLISFDS